MVTALNGTILGKAMSSKGLSYSCDGFCTNDELAAFQISSSFLTKDPLFSSLGLNINTKDLNSTLAENIEYMTFCSSNPDLQCMPSSTMATFFTSHYLGDFEMVDLIWKNQNRVEIIEDQFQLPEGTGESLVKYVNFLHDSYIGKYQQSFSWAQTNYNFL